MVGGAGGLYVQRGFSITDVYMSLSGRQPVLRKLQGNSSGYKALAFGSKFSPQLPYKKFCIRAGEMTQQLRVLTTLLEDPGSILRTHMAVSSCL